MNTNKIKNLARNATKSKDGRTVLSNFGYLTLLQFASYLFPIITVPYLSRVIGVEGYGKIAFASAMMVWVQTVADWGFLLTATRDVAKCRDNKAEVSRIFSETFFARCLLAIVSFIFLCLLILIVPDFKENAEILFVTFLMIPGYIMFPDWFFQAIERMRYTTITNLLVKTIFTVAVFIFIKEKGDYIIVPLLASLGTVAAGIIAMYLILKKWDYSLHRVSFHSVILAIKRSTDVFINNLFPNLYNSLSVVLLGIYDGSVANGIYSEGNKFVNIGQSVLGVVTRVFFPFLSRRIDKHRIYVVVYMGATFCIAVILFVSAPWLIDWLYTDEFADAIPVLRIMSISLVFVAMSTAYGTNYLIVQGHERILRKITMWCSLAGFAIAYPLIIHYSYIGVAVTVTFSRMCLGISSWLAVMKLKKNHLENK